MVAGASEAGRAAGTAEPVGRHADWIYRHWNRQDFVHGPDMFVTRLAKLTRCSSAQNPPNENCHHCYHHCWAGVVSCLNYSLCPRRCKYKFPVYIYMVIDFASKRIHCNITILIIDSLLRLVNAPCRCKTRLINRRSPSTTGSLPFLGSSWGPCWDPSSILCLVPNACCWCLY